jgi:hypothetical protein
MQKAKRDRLAALKSDDISSYRYSLYLLLPVLSLPVVLPVLSLPTTSRPTGTQFTCFTSAKTVQMLTPAELRLQQAHSRLEERADEDGGDAHGRVHGEARRQHQV